MTSPLLLASPMNNALRHILVPRDFSPPSESALHVALGLAARTGAVLHLIHVEVLRDDPHGTPEGAASPSARLRERLREVVDRDRDGGPPYDPGSVRMQHAVVREVAAVPAIVQYARAHGVDLIVMGRHGRPGWQRGVLGSVAEGVTREAPCPVATVPAGHTPAGERPAVLAAVDFSAASASVVAEAARLAAAFAGDLDLLHVVEGADGGDPAREAAALERLTALSESVLSGPGGELPTVHLRVEAGRAGERILEAATTASPAFLVVGPQKRAGLARFLGSVADRAVREAPGPVVVCRPVDGDHTGVAL